MDKLLEKLNNRLPSINFHESDDFSWSPANSTVFYQKNHDEGSLLSLLHEASHALLGHETYRYDLELVLMEVEAWDRAKELAAEIGIKANDDYIQDKLDSYRDWLHQRSTCPRCGVVSTQPKPNIYECHNCLASWKVSSSRFCRPYRLSKYV